VELLCVALHQSLNAGIEIDSIGKLLWQFQHKPCAEPLLLEEKVHPEQLIDRNHTTMIAGLNEMEMHGFSSSLIRGIKTSLKQIKDRLS
jgi:pyrroline-5-carboxylate reductase